jgi:hypothetical protein
MCPWKKGSINGKATIGIELTMTTPKIERLIEVVKYFASSDENQVRPTSRPVSLKEAKGALLSLAQQARARRMHEHA